MLIHKAVAICAVLIILLGARVSGQQPLVELDTSEGRVQGRVVDRTESWARLYDRAGRMATVELKKVTGFRTVAPEFSPHTFVTLRTELLQEFGPEYEVATSRHYLVCAPLGRAKDYVEVFESTWRRFHMYFSIRGFSVQSPEFPMMAVVLRDQAAFQTFAVKEGAHVSNQVLGYYWGTHNRVITFEAPKLASNARAGTAGSDTERLRAMLERDPQWNQPSPLMAGLALSSGVSQDLHETMVHEATHQLGYNTGLHNRRGDDPRWIVEGLATVFETPGMEANSSRSRLARANKGWLLTFRENMKQKRSANFLETYLRDDALFETSTPAAYAQAWALSFFLIETRPRPYAEFLRRMASDEVALVLTPELRLQVFRESFGSNLTGLDVDMLHFYEKLDPATAP